MRQTCARCSNYYVPLEMELQGRISRKKVLFRCPRCGKTRKIKLQPHQYDLDIEEIKFGTPLDVLGIIGAIGILVLSGVVVARMGTKK